ncbi:MAG: GNAT family N-acyltransferase [Polyangiaceae bacterium]
MSAVAISPAVLTPGVEVAKFGGGRSLYANEGLRVTIRAPGGSVTGDVMKIGPAGLSVACDPTESLDLPAGTPVDVEWSPADAPPFVSHGRAKRASLALRSRRSVRELDVAFDPAPPRSADEHALSELHWLTAYAPDPFFFREWHTLKITAAGPRTLRAVASSRARSLVPGLPLALTIVVPVLGSFLVRAHVTGVVPDVRPEEIDVSLAIDEAPADFSEALAELVLAGSDGVTLARLRRDGFALGALTRAMTVGYVENDEDMQQVLALRLAAYHSKNKFAFAKSAADMLDPYDAYSRQIVCRVGSRIVGAVRLVYVDCDRTRSEELALGAPLPDWLFDVPFGEISRLCTHPEFRGSDVLITLLQHLGRVAAMSGLPWLLGSCDDQCPLYEKLGFKKMPGVRYDAYGRAGIDVVAVELKDFFDGRGMGALVWGHVHAPVVDFLARRGIIRPRGLGRVRAALYRVFRGAIERVARVAMNRARDRKKAFRHGCEGCGPR